MNNSTNRSIMSRCASTHTSALKHKMRHLLWQRHEVSMREVQQAAMFCRLCHFQQKDLR